MADRVKGITIQIGGDTTKLSTAIKNADKEIKQTQSDLKDVEKLLKVDPKNIELLAQKEKLLAQNVEQVATKLADLREKEIAVQEAVANGKASQEQYDGLRREIAATEQALKKATDAQAQFILDGGKLKGVAEKMSSISTVADKVASKTKVLSASAGALLVSFGALTLKTVELSDDLNTLANQTGLTTEQIQEFQYASDIVDVSVSDMVGALTKLKKNMGSTSSSVKEAFDKIGVSVYDNAGQFKDIDKLFQDVLTGLSLIPNETERDIVAMELLGKSADSLAGIIDDGGKKLRELGQEARDSGLILSQETLDALNQVNDKIDETKAKAQATLSVTGAKAMETLAPVFDWLIEKMGDVLMWVAELDTDTIKMGLTIAGVVAIISPVAGIISGIASAISGIISILPALEVLLASIDLKTTAIAVVVGALVTIFAELASVWNDMSGADKLVSVLGAVGAAALAAALALGVFQSAATMGVAAVGIVAGIAAILVAIENTKKKMQQLPQLANGGVVGEGGMAIVGERGAEVLTNVNGNAVVTPLKANVDTGAITDAIRSGQGSQNVNIQFSGSLAQLGRVLQPVIVNETQRKGTSAIRYV